MGRTRPEGGRAAAMTVDRGRVVPNALLQQARLRAASAAGPGLPMSRADPADAVSAHVMTWTGHPAPVDAAYIGQLERGECRWPNQRYRAALRAILQTATDADLGFTTVRRP